MEQPAQTPCEVGAESVHLLSDEYLIDFIGHLSPNEIVSLAIEPQYKARIAQLQMNALHSAGGVNNEWIEWLACYHQVCGGSDDYS